MLVPFIFGLLFIIAKIISESMINKLADIRSPRCSITAINNTGFPIS